MDMMPPSPPCPPLLAWHRAVAALPVRDHRRVGLLLLQLGAAILIAGSFLTPPWMNAGLGIAAAGALLARPPVQRLGPVLAGALLAAWLLLSSGAAWLHGAKLDLPGPVYRWLPLPLVACAAVSSRWRTLALRALVCTAAAAAVVGLLQFVLGRGNGFLRIDPSRGDFKQASGFAAVTLTYGFVSALLLVVWARSAGDRPGWTWAGRIIGAVGLATAGSRGAMLAGIAGLGAVQLTRGRRWLIYGGAIVLVLAGALFARMAITERSRLQKLLEGRDGRWPIWMASLDIVARNPVLGVGSRDAFTAAYPEAFARAVPGQVSEFPDGAPHAHNTFLALAAEYGLPAVALHLALVGSVLVVTWRTRRQRPQAWSLAIGVAVTGVVGGCFEPYATQSVPGFAFHGLLGLALGMADGDASPGDGAEPPQVKESNKIT